eukprot:TRINITY_DN6152_c0_g1_i1.p1 TRINITY_DN6152_c0_g1~~TRINITY_DN6152_c0_g1_i1.p1  ORF type:complete len:159 (-),score=32.34 TRINITY_DN6152_c0_g1_i1:4-480(-)
MRYTMRGLGPTLTSYLTTLISSLISRLIFHLSCLSSFLISGRVGSGRHSLSFSFLLFFLSHFFTFPSLFSFFPSSHSILYLSSLLFFFFFFLLSFSSDSDLLLSPFISSPSLLSYLLFFSISSFSFIFSSFLLSIPFQIHSDPSVLILSLPVLPRTLR